MMQQNLFSQFVVVTGSRSITDVEFVYQCLDDFVKFYGIEMSKIVLLSGHANGVDRLAEFWAKDRHVPEDRIMTFIPEWRKYGLSAGMVRNKLMVDNADYVCGIWDGVSKGTKQCLDYAGKQNKLVKVYKK